MSVVAAGLGAGHVEHAPGVTVDRVGRVGVPGQGGGGDQVPDGFLGVALDGYRTRLVEFVSFEPGPFPSSARFTAMNAWASMLEVTWRCQAGQVRTW